MSLRLEINGVDFTAYWRVYESRWTLRAWNGESFVSEFLLDDPGTFVHANLAARKVVEVWEDASGSDVCLYRGRVSNKHLGMSGVQNQNDMRWTVEAEDANIELRGIRVNNAVRPIETDEVRVEAIRVAFLNGAASSHPEARDSTDMGNTYIGDGLAVNLEAETYTDTDPLGVLNRIVEVSGRTFFVTLNDDGTMELYYGNHTSEDYVATDIELTDAGVADGAVDAAGTPSVDVYAVYKGPNAGEHAGQNVLTGGALRWGDGNLWEDSDIAGAEAVYDKWEETFTNEFVQHTTQADNILNKLVGLSDEDFTYLASIDMRADQVHRLRNGMMVLLKRYRANKPVQGYVRIAQIQYEPLWPDEDGEAWYRVTMDLGRAQGRRLIPRGRHQPGPYHPVQPTEGSCTRLYFSTDSAGFNVAQASGWADDATVNTDLLKTSPDATMPGTGSGITWSAINAGAGDYVGGMDAWGFQITDAGLLADIQAGGLTFEAHIRARSRFGIGINEASQDNRAQRVVRIYRPSTTTFLGTALALDASATGPKFIPTTTHINRQFSGTLAAVATAALNDWIIVEIGTAHFGPTSGGTGAAWALTSDNADDLPDDEITNTNLNSWIDLCSSGSSGSETEPVAGEGGGSAGTSNVYAPIDHVHEHGLLSEDEIHYHDESQVEGSDDYVEAIRTDSDSPGVGDDEDDGYRAGDIWVDRTANEAFILTDGTVGAAVWEQFIPSSSVGLTVEEEDASPSVSAVDTIQVPNGTLTNDGGGTVSLDYAASGHSHGGSGIPGGTSFPGSPANNDIFYRTDRDLLYFYDGTRWLTVTEYEQSAQLTGAAGATSDTNVYILPIRADGDTFLTKFYASTRVIVANTWVLNLMYIGSAGSQTSIATLSTAGDSSNTETRHETDIDALVPNGAYHLMMYLDEQTGSTSCTASAVIRYRRVG